MASRTPPLVLTALVGVLMMATAVSAQTASAFLHQVEGGRWELSPGSSLAYPGERICLEESAYVLAGRVEPGHGGLWVLSQEGEFGLNPESGIVEGLARAEGFVAGARIGEDNGSRWSWYSFTAADGQCFEMWATVQGGSQEGRQPSRQTTFQQLLELRQKLEQEQNVRARLGLQREISQLQLELQLQPAALRLRLYELRVRVDW